MASIVIKPIFIRENQSIINNFLESLHVNEHRLFEKTAPWSEIGKNYMAHLMDMQENFDGLCLLTMVGNQPAGFIFGYLDEPDESRIEVYTGKELYISDGYVSPQFRRMGLYRAMNHHLEQHYKELGIKRMSRFTLSNNTEMQRFLESENYAVTRLLYEKWI